MEQQIIANGGLQYIPQIAVQYVYLDFDGALTSYNGEILTVDNVEIQDSSLTGERIKNILTELNTKYADQNVIFVPQRPTVAEYSTIFIGKTSAFNEYGNFTGLAETIDEGNENKTDNAFVMLDSSASDEAIIATISHETDHLLGTLDHGGSGLAAYAEIYYNVNNGITSTGVTLEGDYMYISSGGVANDTTINVLGSMRISSGGVANNTTVNDGGCMSICSGGSALSVKENGGCVHLAEGAYVTFLPNTIQGLTKQGGMTVHSNTIAVSTTLKTAGYMHIYTGGMANSTIVNFAGMFISGGSADTTIVNSWGSMYIYSGGVAKNTTVYGSMYVSSGGTAYSTTVNSGGLITIAYGGSADIAFDPWQSGVVSKAGANVTYYNDAKIYYGDRYSGLISKYDSVSCLAVRCSAIVYSGGVVNDAVIDYGSMYINSGGIANGTAVSGGDFFVSSGGSANKTLISQYGNMYVSSDAYAAGTVISGYSATMYISSGGTASNTILSWGGMYVSSGGSADGVTVRMDPVSGSSSRAGGINVASGGIVNNVLVESNGVLYLSGCAHNVVVQGRLGGGSASNVTVESRGEISGYLTSAIIKSGAQAYISGANETQLYGAMIVASNGSADNTTIERSGVMYIHSSGTAANTTVLSGGTMHVSGTANETTVNSGGYIYFDYSKASSHRNLTLLKGGIIGGCFTYTEDKHWDTLIGSNGRVTVEDNVFVGSDWAGISSGGTAHDMVIHSNGVIWVNSGGSADHTIIENGSIIVTDGGTACNTTVNGSGNLNIYMDGTASGTILNPGGKLNLLSSGSAVDTLIKSGGSVTFSSCGILSNTTIESGGVLILSSGGRANQTTVFSGGTLTLARDGSASGLIVHSGAEVNVIDNVFINIYGSDTLGYVSFSDWGGLTVRSGGFVHDIMIGSNGQLSVRDNGSASAVVINGGWAGVSNASDITVNSGGILRIGGSASDVVIHSGGSICVDSSTSECFAEIKSGGTLQLLNDNVFAHGDIDIETGANISFLINYETDVYSWIVDDFSLINGAYNYQIKFTNRGCGTYKLARKANDFKGTISIGDGTTVFGNITVNGAALEYNDLYYSVREAGGDLTLKVSETPDYILPGTRTGVSFDQVPGESFRVEYSGDNFSSVLQIKTENKAIDTFNLPGGTYRWQVSGDHGITWHEGNIIISDDTPAPANIISDADGDMDLFFAEADDCWSNGYAAEHQGSLNGWTGTHEQVMLTGKNRFTDTFSGSTDANVLILTDDANGDALFVDDIYSALGAVARLSQIDEIRAGAGDDVIDMTSQKFAYSGDTMKIYGGLGNDTIWAANGENYLYGDAGNDRLVGGAGNDVIAGGDDDDAMHGGGGNDIFTFSDNWGNDIVEQLAGGSVTLWFEEDPGGIWDAETLTYTAGEHSVRVIGTVPVVLKFGDDQSELYDTLHAADAFEDDTIEKIFEDRNSGMLA